MSDQLRIIALGGLGEIGLNMMVFEYQDSIMIVDAGLMFPEEYMLGIDMVIPDTTYLKDKQEKIKGIVLTHGHEDHIGALPFIVGGITAPIYGTPFTLALVNYKLKAHHIANPPPLVEVRPRERCQVGPFDVEFISVSHSVVDGVGLAIRTPAGVVIHSGDFKINQIPTQGQITDINRFADYGERGVLALMSDSTNVEREGYTLSEQQIGDRLLALFRECSGRIIVALFASNVCRIQQIVNAAKVLRRKVAFCGRSMQASVGIAKDLGYLDLPEEMDLSLGQIKNTPDSEIIIVTTGSQGEPMSVLSRIASGSHKQIKLKPGDTVVLSSKSVPGNERTVSHVINRLYKHGAEVFYEKVSNIHASGHAFQEELKLLINLTKPRYFIPIHGELRHLIQHGHLAQTVGIPEERVLRTENGRLVTFDELGGRLDGEVPTGRVLVDGKSVADAEKSVLRERRDLAEDGLVIVVVVLSSHDFALLSGPDIESHGFLFKDYKNDILETARGVVLETIETMDSTVPSRADALKAKIKKALRQHFQEVIHKWPVIFPIVLEV